jgi:hypothetical protein
MHLKHGPSLLRGNGTVVPEHRHIVFEFAVCLAIRLTLAIIVRLSHAAGPGIVEIGVVQSGQPGRVGRLWPLNHISCTLHNFSHIN